MFLYHLLWFTSTTAPHPIATAYGHACGFGDLHKFSLRIIKDAQRRFRRWMRRRNVLTSTERTSSYTDDAIIRAIDGQGGNGSAGGSCM